MERPSINQARNLLFINLYGFGNFLHLAMILIMSLYDSLSAVIFGIPTYFIILLLHYRKKNERVIQILILLLMNIYVFLVSIESFTAIIIAFFAIPIIASALYNDTRSILALGLLSVIEIFVVVFVFDGFERQPPVAYDHITLLVFISIVLVLTISHSVYFSRIWSQMEMKNQFMEQALLSREGYLHLFFETAKDAIAVFDMENRIIAINPAFEKLYGWSPEECIGKDLPLFPPESSMEGSIRAQKVQSGESFTLLETLDMKKDGTQFPAQVTLSPIFNQSGAVIATSAISRDITFQKEAEKLIIQSEKLKLAGEIAAGVAHEIRNPLTVISGFVQMMDSAPDYPYKRYTHLIQSEIERIDLIISEFLVLSKPQASIQKTFGLQQTLKDITALFGPEFNLHGIAFSQFWQEEDYFLKGEENQLKQVFINIFKNAIEAIEDKGKICLGVRDDGDGVVAITLNDNGEGIPEEFLSKIFEPFYTTKSSGTGLGMMISQKIIQNHGGQLTLASEEGLGTEVTIKLPYLKAAEVS